MGDKGGRHIPRILNLEHKHESRRDEAGAADDLGNPVHSVHGWYGEGVVDRRQGREARYPEDAGSQQLGKGREEADLFDVVCFEIAPGRPPGPSSLLVTLVSVSPSR